MVLLRTHSHKVQLKDQVSLHVTQTVTTEELKLPTLCKKEIYIFLFQEDPSGSSFFI